jgi:predicted transcriptional regulator
MTATVRFDKEREAELESICKLLNQAKSEVIRDAISYYAQYVINDKKKRILDAVKKVKESDKKEALELEGTLDDAL